MQQHFTRWRGLVPWSLLSLLAACSSGGGGSAPTSSFSFLDPSGSIDEDAGPLAIEVELHTKDGPLASALTVEVADAGGGNAVSGSDYQPFPVQTLTFPVGSVEGDRQTVTLTPIDDLLVEGRDETVRLRLQNPGVAGISGNTTFTATLVDVHRAYPAFVSPASATPDESSGPHAIAVELETTPPGATLGFDISVRVSDQRSGDATSGVDYQSFSSQTITFQSGAVDGAVQTVNLVVIDDSAVEPDETVQLRLTVVTSGIVLSGFSGHELTIVDDDSTGDPALLASEGSSGIENPLSYDELIDLGTRGVGAGPNAGTLLRVLSAGGAPLSLGTPSLTGAQPDDFSLEVESASFSAGDPSAQLAPGEALLPLVERGALGAAGPGIALAIDPERLARLAPLSAVTLHGFPVPDLGSVSLELRRLPLPVARDAVLEIDGVPLAGGPSTLLGDLQLWSGSVQGLEGSRVYLALSSTQARGFLQLPVSRDRLVHVLADEQGCHIVRGPEAQALGLDGGGSFCSQPPVLPGQPGLPEMRSSQAPTGPGTSALTVAECRLALETDFQLYGQFNSSALLTSYVTQLIGAISDRYYTDVQTHLVIAYLGIHTGSNDGWDAQDSGGNSGDVLAEFRAAWMGNIPNQANLAHFLSGANLGGGVAYVNVLCNSSFGFGVSGNLSGNIVWTTWTGQPGNFTWDFVVVAHELGHNFGSRHTHDYCPPLDLCSSNCNGSTMCSQGTLMSYCHLCGGMDNIDLVFHPACANDMRQSVNASCLGSSTLAPGDYVQYLLRFDPTATGLRNATLEFPHDGTNQTQPFRLQLRGTGN